MIALRDIKCLFFSLLKKIQKWYIIKLTNKERRRFLMNSINELKKMSEKERALWLLKEYDKILEADMKLQKKLNRTEKYWQFIEDKLN